jgi:HK97 family phage major capsid protein|nr:MAG TPA: major capsid protein [Caudoviricetes sp.]
MRKIAEIRRDLAAKAAEVKGIQNSPENAEALKKGIEELKALMLELEQAEAVEAAAQQAADRELDRRQRVAGRPFSLVRYIAGIVSGNLEGIEKEVDEMGAKEYERLGLVRQGHVIPSAYLRAASGQNYTTAADGGNLTEEGERRYLDILRDKLVVAGLGATVLTDLVGTFTAISSSAVQAAWEGEADKNELKKVTYSKLTMTPHRSSVSVATTKDLLRQTSFDVEADLLNKITDAHADLLEKAAINGSGSDGEPTGILNTSGIGSVAIGTNGGALTWKNVVALETEVNSKNANRGRMAYLSNAKVNGALKVTEMAAGTARFLLSNEAPKTLNGYPFDWTNLVPSTLTKGTAASKCSALIFGNFQDLYIGQWGGIDIVVDPYTGARNGEIYLTLNAWNDIKVVEPKSFAAIVDITTD